MHRNASVEHVVLEFFLCSDFSDVTHNSIQAIQECKWRLLHCAALCCQVKIAAVSMIWTCCWIQCIKDTGFQLSLCNASLFAR